MSSLFTLYVWPGRWDLPSIDASCLTAIAYLQLSGVVFSIVETADPDVSPSGTLPMLTHHGHNISPLSSITAYLTNCNVRGLDEANQKGQSVAWCAHIEANLGALIYHMFYARFDNWAQITHKIYVSMYPIPIRYFAPRRLREVYRRKLEASGMWIDTEDVDLNKLRKLKNDEKDKMIKAFSDQKIMEKAHSFFELYARLIASFNSPTLSIVDITLASHILLLIAPDFPDPLIKDVIVNKYPSLVEHARSVQSRAFPSSLIIEKRTKYLEYYLTPWFVTEETKGGWQAVGIGAVAICGFAILKRLSFLK